MYLPGQLSAESPAELFSKIASAFGTPESPHDTGPHVPTTPKYFDASNAGPQFADYHACAAHARRPHNTSHTGRPTDAANAGVSESKSASSLLLDDERVPVLPGDEVALPVPSLSPEKGKVVNSDSARLTPLSQRRKHASKSLTPDYGSPSPNLSSPEFSKYSDESEASTDQPSTPSPLSQRRKRRKAAEGDEPKKESGDTTDHNSSRDESDSGSLAADHPQQLPTLSQRRKRTKLTITKPLPSPSSPDPSSSPAATPPIAEAQQPTTPPINTTEREIEESPSGILTPPVTSTSGNAYSNSSNVSFSDAERNVTPTSHSSISSIITDSTPSPTHTNSFTELNSSNASDSMNSNSNSNSNLNSSTESSGRGKIINSAASIANLIHTTDTYEIDTTFSIHTRTAPTKPKTEIETKMEYDARASTHAPSSDAHNDAPLDLPSSGNKNSKRKRPKPDVAPAQEQAVAQRLRSSVRRPNPSPSPSPLPLEPPSPDNSRVSPAKGTKRKTATEPLPPPPSTRHRTATSASPSSSAPPSPHSPLPSPTSPHHYPHLPHPPMLTSFSYPLHGSPRRVAEPYCYYYPSNAPSPFASPPSPPHPLPPTPSPSASASTSTSTSSSTASATTTHSSTTTSPPSRKVPSCTRCAARAAWKHDKKGKRWFCKICKLPFTPGVSPAQKLKEVVTIPPCPKCYSNEGWKQEKGRYFCTHCKRSFRPRIARSTTRSSTRKSYGDEKKEDSYDGEEEEGEEEDGEDAGDDDSDYGTRDVPHFTPDVESNNPYYRGNSKKQQNDKKSSTPTQPQYFYAKEEPAWPNAEENNKPTNNKNYKNNNNNNDNQNNQGMWKHNLPNIQNITNIQNLQNIQNEHPNFKFSPSPVIRTDRLQQYMPNYSHTGVNYHNGPIYNGANYNHGGPIYNQHGRGYNNGTTYNEPDIEDTVDHDDVTQILLEMKGNKN